MARVPVIVYTWRGEGLRPISVPGGSVLPHELLP